jgi:hypothetical protein
MLHGQVDEEDGGIEDIIQRYQRIIRKKKVLSNDSDSGDDNVQTMTSNGDKCNEQQDKAQSDIEENAQVYQLEQSFVLETNEYESHESAPDECENEDGSPSAITIIRQKQITSLTACQDGVEKDTNIPASDANGDNDGTEQQNSNSSNNSPNNTTDPPKDAPAPEPLAV